MFYIFSFIPSKVKIINLGGPWPLRTKAAHTTWILFGGFQVKRTHVSQCKLVRQEIMAMAKAGPQTILWVSVFVLSFNPWNCLQAYGPTQI
jgi:hypothetical protein